MRFFKVTLWFLLTSALSWSDVIMAQKLRVLVLDASNGKPQVGVQIHYFCTGKPNSVPPGSASTNQNGLADITYSCGDGEEIELWTSAPKGKEQCGDLPPLPFSLIMSQGIVSKPDGGGSIWCPTKVSKTLKPVPGQITVFVKKPTWWQSHIAG
jgi:hypothetical protein